MTVRFELYGHTMEMEMSKFVEMTEQLCKSIVGSNRSWKHFCENEFKVIEIKA